MGSLASQEQAGLWLRRNFRGYLWRKTLATLSFLDQEHVGNSAVRSDCTAEQGLFEFGKYLAAPVACKLSQVVAVRTVLPSCQCQEHRRISLPMAQIVELT
jgi:hypothetical protein